jgi:hypothetical protein
MNERFKLSLSGIWLLISLFALVFPVFLPSVADSSNPASNVIGTATATMFILSFPSSLFGIPLLMMIDFALGVDPNSIQGMYVNLFVLFVLGLVQWFWIVPRIWRHDPDIQMLDLPVMAETIRLPEMKRSNFEFGGFDEHERTPVERVIRDDRDQFS